MAEMLRLEKLTKAFGRREVLRGIDLVLEPGKVYGLLGRNGEGKTTLVRTIMGVIPSDAGKIVFRGQPVGSGSPAYKQKIGYVPEDAFFYGWMSVRQVLDFNSRFYWPDDGWRPEGLIERFELDPDAKVRTLSRGQRLKLAFAVALTADPDLLILDDPTSGLDVPTRRDFLRDVIRQLADRGTTVLFATHLVHELERIVDHLLILRGGRVILDEPFEKIREQARRVLLRFDDGAPPIPRLETIIGERRAGREIDLIVYPWNSRAETAIQALGPVQVEFVPLSLEDLFTSFVDGPQAQAEEPDHV